MYKKPPTWPAAFLPLVLELQETVAMNLKTFTNGHIILHLINLRTCLSAAIIIFQTKIKKNLWNMYFEYGYLYMDHLKEFL